MLVTAKVPIAGQSEPEPAVTYKVCPSQAHLQALPRPSHPSHPEVSEQHKYCVCIGGELERKQGGRQLCQQAAPSREASLAFPALVCSAPARLQQDLGPAHFQPACHGKLPQAAVSTFPLWCLLFSYLGNWNL